MIERIIFNILAFVLFIYVFFRMIQKNDTNYIYILVLQAIGIAIAFIFLIIKANMPLAVLAITYLFSIIIPIIIIFIEKKGIALTELIYLTLAKIYITTNKENKARAILLKLVEKEQESYWAHKMLAEVYEKEGKKEVALEEYLRTNEIREEDDKIVYKIAYLYNECERPNEAIKLLQLLIKKTPDWQEASILLGDIYQEQERFKEAVNVYLDAINYHPENYDLYYNLGIVYTRLNDFKSAKDYYEKAAELNSLLYKAKYNLGQISLLYNEMDEAIMYFEQCLQSEELEDDTYFYLAYIAMLKGEEEKAIQYLNAAVSERPELFERAKEEVIFKLIMNKIDRPHKNIKSEEKPSFKISKKERNAIEHLRHTYELVGNLSHNDIKAMRVIQAKREQKEREEM